MNENKREPDVNLTKEELLEEFEEMWKSAVIGSTWKLNKGARQAYQQIVALINKPEVSG